MSMTTQLPTSNEIVRILKGKNSETLCESVRVGNYADYLHVTCVDLTLHIWCLGGVQLLQGYLPPRFLGRRVLWVRNTHADVILSKGLAMLYGADYPYHRTRVTLQWNLQIRDMTFVLCREVIFSRRYAFVLCREVVVLYQRLHYSYLNGTFQRVHKINDISKKERICHCENPAKHRSPPVLAHEPGSAAEMGYAALQSL